MTTKDIEGKIEKCVKTVETVEFLHGVPVSLPSQYKADLRGAMRAALTEVWNEAIKECEGCVPKKDNILFGFSMIINEKPENNPDYNKGFLTGHNSCREQTLQAISKLRV